MGTVALSCPAVMENGTGAGTFGAIFNPPPPPPPSPDGTVPPLSPIEFIPVDVEEDMDLVDLAILSVVNLGSWIHLSILIRLT